MIQERRRYGSCLSIPDLSSASLTRSCALSFLLDHSPLLVVAATLGEPHCNSIITRRRGTTVLEGTGILRHPANVWMLPSASVSCRRYPHQKQPSVRCSWHARLHCWCIHSPLFSHSFRNSLLFFPSLLCPSLRSSSILFSTSCFSSCFMSRPVLLLLLFCFLPFFLLFSILVTNISLIWAPFCWACNGLSLRSSSSASFWKDQRLPLLGNQSLAISQKQRACFL